MMPATASTAPARPLGVARASKKSAPGVRVRVRVRVRVGVGVGVGVRVGV